MEKSLYSEQDELTAFQTLQFDEIIAILKEIIIETKNENLNNKMSKIKNIDSHRKNMS